VRRAGVLLDTGPLVALLSRNDAHHERAVHLFDDCAPPLRSCEAVIAEACFLMRKVHPAGPAEVVSLERRGVFGLGLSVAEHWPERDRGTADEVRGPADLAGDVAGGSTSCDAVACCQDSRRSERGPRVRLIRVAPTFRSALRANATAVKSSAGVGIHGPFQRASPSHSGH
jgi:hypothetical protein